VIKQLPGEVQRVSVDARQRAAEAVEKGKAAARRRDAELALQLEGAGSRQAGAPPPVTFSPPAPAAVAPEAPATSPAAVAPEAPATPPAAAPGPDTA
jgi:hypothetical protein